MAAALSSCDLLTSSAFLKFSYRRSISSPGCQLINLDLPDRVNFYSHPQCCSRDLGAGNTCATSDVFHDLKSAFNRKFGSTIVGSIDNRHVFRSRTRVSQLASSITEDIFSEKTEESNISEPRLYSELNTNVLVPSELQYPACPRWRRVLLKVSGEALAGDGTSNIDPKVTAAIAKEVAVITRLGVEVAIVVGGGNFFRGAAWAGASGLDRASADQIGMMATVMNAIFLQASLESIGVPTRVQTAFSISEVAEPYIRRRAIRHLEKGRVVIFGAGTGNPFFTTDSAAALRAAEINAEVVLKGTNVDGVYDSDPRRNPSAKLIPHLSHREVQARELQVMDITAITLCQENSIPVVVFNLNIPGNITKALSGELIGTLIEDQD